MGSADAREQFVNGTQHDEYSRPWNHSDVLARTTTGIRSSIWARWVSDAVILTRLGEATEDCKVA